MSSDIYIFRDLAFFFCMFKWFDFNDTSRNLSTSFNAFSHLIFKYILFILENFMYYANVFWSSHSLLNSLRTPPLKPLPTPAPAQNFMSFLLNSFPLFFFLTFGGSLEVISPGIILFILPVNLTKFKSNQTFLLFLKRKNLRILGVCILSNIHAPGIWYFVFITLVRLQNSFVITLYT